MNLLERNVSTIVESAKWPNLEGKKVLVTGGTGLVGIHMAGFFAAMGAYVEAIYKVEPSQKHLDIMYPIDLMQFDLANDVMEDYPMFDYIIHAAGYSSPAVFIKDPLSTIAVNASCVRKLFNQLVPGGKFLYISSDAVYSGNKNEVHRETDIGSTPLDDPRAGYIESKKLGEIITHQLGGHIVRLSYAYGLGPKLNDARVLNSFITQALTTGKIVLHDTGQAIRSWLYITDAVEMMLKVLFHGNPGEAYNIANVKRHKYSIRDLASLIANLTDTCFEVSPSNDEVVKSAPVSHMLSIDKYEAQFGTRRFTHLLYGLERTISWYRYLLGKDQPIQKYSSEINPHV